MRALAILALSLTGCASVPRPDPLMASRLTASALGEALTAKSHELDRALLADANARAATCPETAPERAACRQSAFVAASLAQGQARAEHGFLVLLQHAAAHTLNTALQCRKDDATCEDKAKAEAEKLIAEIRALLLRSP